MSGLIRRSLNDRRDPPLRSLTRPVGSGRHRYQSSRTGAFRPGWRSSEHVKPNAKTDNSDTARTCYFVSDRMKVVTDDRPEMKYSAGDFAVKVPGHYAWIIGNQPGVVMDWPCSADYAQPEAS
jgi:hypothetical protein